MRRTEEPPGGSHVLLEQRQRRLQLPQAQVDVGQLVDCSQQQQQSTVRVRNSRRPFAALTAAQRVGVLVAEGGAVARQRLLR